VNLRQILTAPNQLTLLRMIFLPFIVINLVKQDFKWALALFVLAGLSDGLDGLLARTLHQQTLLGQYLDPIADKLLMSTMFLVLSIERMIPWKYTVMVFSRDISILLIGGVLFMIAGLRDFRPSIFGKANTFAQVSAIFFVLLLLIEPVRWVWIARTPSCAPRSSSPLSPRYTMHSWCSTGCTIPRPALFHSNRRLRGLLKRARLSSTQPSPPEPTSPRAAADSVAPIASA
jgi:cardiolipin synthase (CMP-forming)